MQKIKTIISKKNVIPYIGITILIILNYIIGIILLPYSRNYDLILLIILLSLGLLMYFIHLLDFDYITKNMIFIITSFFDFAIITFVLFSGSQGSDNALKVAYSILIFTNIIYFQIKKTYSSIFSIVFIGIMFFIFRMFLLIIIIGTLSVAGLAS